MRLICPNCGAQYAVDDRVIPEAGRDVQCSNCGNTWFQKHPDQDAELASELGLGLPDSLTDRPTPQQASPRPEQAQPPVEDEGWSSQQETVPETRGELVEDVHDIVASAPEPDLTTRSYFDPDLEEEQDLPDDDEMPVEAGADVEPSAESAPVRRPLDDDVMSVLREEAALERAARKAESEALETQGELDIPPPGPSAPHAPLAYEVAPRSPARVKPSDTIPAEAHRGDRAAPRRDLLPDVEEINSSLRPEDSAADAAGRMTAEARERRSRGQRLGFALAFMVFGGLSVLYLQAARVSDSVPSADNALKIYIAAVDSGRVWIDETLRKAVEGDGGN